MPKNRSPLQQPIDAVIFDCDGTLSKIEGIDELAMQNGVGNQVKALTSKAMGQTGLTEELYGQRLNLVKPTKAQAEALGKLYLTHITKDTQSVIESLHQSGKSVYIASAGISTAVKLFGNALSIPSEHIFSVDIQFDEHGNYQDFDHTSPLITNNGKREIVAHIKQRHQHIAFVGDGLNDVSVIQDVTRFIGYGGAFYRKNIEDMCEFYVKTESMTEILAFI